MRGTPKFVIPKVTYPLQPKVALIFNNQNPWTSLLSSMAKISDWFYKNSGGKLEVNISNPYPVTNFNNIPTFAQGSGMGAITQVIDENWYRQNILPLAPNHDIYIFVLRPEDYPGQVYNQNNLVEYGYSYEPHYPLKTFIVAEENTEYPPDYPDPDLEGFAKFAVHEILHGLYGIAINDSLTQGTDLTHTHLYGLNNNPVEPAACFNDLDIDYLNQKIN